MTIKWTVKDVIDGFEKAIRSSTSQNGNNQLLQQLLDKKAQPTTKVQERK